MQQFFRNNHNNNANTAALTQGILQASTELLKLLNGVFQSRQINELEHVNELRHEDPAPGLNHGE